MGTIRQTEAKRLTPTQFYTTDTVLTAFRFLIELDLLNTVVNVYIF